jgi:peptide/nickel transport system permease protein
VQYLGYVGDVLTGDLGRSARDGQPVADLIADRLPATLELAVLSLLAAIAIAVPAGIFAARGSGRLSGVVTSAITLTGLSVPAFWFAIMLIYLFAVELQWFNAGGYVPLTVNWQANLALMALPVLATGFRRSAEIARFVRASVLDAATADYVRVASAKGLSDGRIMRRHILPNAMIPVVTVTGLQMAEMLGGLVLTETVFGIPGLGRLIVDSIFSRDFVVVQGCLLVAAVLVVVVNTLVDLLYTRMDPRISLEAAGV